MELFYFLSYVVLIISKTGEGSKKTSRFPSVKRRA
jgi:hypothetical protein